MAAQNAQVLPVAPAPMTHRMQQRQVVTCQICKLPGHTAELRTRPNNSVQEPTVYTNHQHQNKCGSQVAARNAPAYADIFPSMFHKFQRSTNTQNEPQSSSPNEGGISTLDALSYERESNGCQTHLLLSNEAEKTVRTPMINTNKAVFEINGKEVEALVDTGANVSAISIERLRELVKGWES